MKSHITKSISKIHPFKFSIITLLLCLCTLQKSFSQELPKALVTGISNTLRSVLISGKDSVDMYTVAIKLEPNGTVSKTFFSIGTSEITKLHITERISAAYVEFVELKDYWRKYCFDNKITKPVIFVQTALTRSYETDKAKLSVTEFVMKYQKALTFAEAPGFQWGDANVIWLPAKITRFDDRQIVE